MSDPSRSDDFVEKKQADQRTDDSGAPESFCNSSDEPADDAEVEVSQTASPDADASSEVGDQGEPVSDHESAVETVDDDDEDDDDLTGLLEPEPAPEDLPREWFILKVQVNREDSIRAALIRRIKIEGLEGYFGEIIVPTEDIAEYNKSGKRRIVKRKLYPGYLLVNMAITDDTWFLVRETPGVGDFTGSAGKPTPMDAHEVERILRLGEGEQEGGAQIKTAIPFRIGDRVRVKDGNFQNFEGDVESIDEANGRITVVITIFNRSTPVELEHWQLEAV